MSPAEVACVFSETGQRSGDQRGAVVRRDGRYSAGGGVLDEPFRQEMGSMEATALIEPNFMLYVRNHKLLRNYLTECARRERCGLEELFASVELVDGTRVGHDVASDDMEGAGYAGVFLKVAVDKVDGVLQTPRPVHEGEVATLQDLANLRQLHAEQIGHIETETEYVASLLLLLDDEGTCAFISTLETVLEAVQSGQLGNLRNEVRCC